MPVQYEKAAGKPYRPSNGTEGEMFCEAFCYRCKHDADPDDGCNILLASYIFSIGDDDYPSEWIYDDDGRPTCTKYEHGDRT